MIITIVKILEDLYSAFLCTSLLKNLLQLGNCVPSHEATHKDKIDSAIEKETKLSAACRR